MRVGVLALQGDVREHRAALEAVGAEVVDVRRPTDLDGIDGVVLPGGESTTLSMLLESAALFEPLAGALKAGLPAFGTCAGMILLAERIEDGRPDQRCFGVLDCTVRRNGYARQLFSFESDLTVPALDASAGPLVGPPAGLPLGPEPPGAEPPGTGARAGDPLHAVFIRAPVVVAAGPEVEVLATLPGRDGAPAQPVAVRQGSVLATTFHPELTGDHRLHRLFVALASPATTDR